VKATAPIEAASGPTWIRTSEKSVLKAVSIFRCTASGRRCPVPVRPNWTVAGNGTAKPARGDAWTIPALWGGAGSRGCPPGKKP